LKHSKRILVAPLNWGLGHATRCIPIINALLSLDYEVFLASDGRALKLLEKEFPDLRIFELPSYDIRYPTSNMVLNVAMQGPKILQAIWKEKMAIRKIIADEKIDVIISDNRFGCYSKDVKSIFLTHQINIKTPIPILDKFVAIFNNFLIKKFDECWIPDFKDEPNLAGNLSHDFELKKVRYIGSLSRMTFFQKPKKYDVITILSGPEPQRTRLENIILKQAKESDLKFLIVQGKTESEEKISKNENIKIVPFLTSKELNSAIMESKIVICRSGYSSIMDLVNLKKKAFLIPTPDQTEQEFLAKRLFQKGIFYYQNQKNFNLQIGLKESVKFTGFHEIFTVGNSLEAAIKTLE
jgi:uncharacterized protein (TIGR00661 family)